MDPDVISIGDITTDILLYISNYPNRGQDVKASKFRIDLGGSATNFAVAMRRLGLSSGIIGKVGDDKLGDLAVAELKKEKVDISHVGIEKGAPTGLVISVVDRYGERTMFSARGANDRLRPEEVDVKYVRKAKLLHISGYSLISDISRKTVFKYAQVAKENGALISFDPGPLLRLIKPRIIFQILNLVDVFLPNAAELKMISKGESFVRSIDYVLNHGPKIIGLKLGRKGCIIAQKGEKVIIPAFRVNVIDTTGAGDAWGAGFLTAILLNPHGSLKDWGRLANATAALSVKKEGASSSMPKMHEVKVFLRKQRA